MEVLRDFEWVSIVISNCDYKANDSENVKIRDIVINEEDCAQFFKIL